MDRRVKERLVGATILMVLIVLIVPELLSGPKARVTPGQAPSAAGPVEAVRNVTVDLATSKATPADNNAAENALADGPAASAASPFADGSSANGAAVSSVAASAAAASGDAADRGATIATLKAQQPAHPTEPQLESELSIPRSAQQASKSGISSPAAPASVSNHHWAVQLGSFASRANAEKLVHQRKPHDAAIYISPNGKGAAARYRVRIGPLADRDAAERMVARLKKEGQPASLVPP